MNGETPTRLATVDSVATLRRRWFWRISVAAIGVVILTGILVFSLLDFRSPFSQGWRWIVWIALVGTAAWFLFENRHRILRQFTSSETAGAMERAHPEVGQKIRTALEVTTESDVTGRHGFRDRLIDETERFLAANDWRRLIPRTRARNWLLACGGLGAVLFVAAIAWPEFGTGVKRILFPGSGLTYTRVAWENAPEWFDQRHPPLLQVTVSGRTAIPKLFVREDGSGDWETVALNPRDNSPLWDAVLNGREKSLTLYAVAGDGRTKNLRLEYEPIPELREASVALEFPAYIERPDETRSGGDVRALEGTRATWTFVFNTAPAKVEWDTGAPEPEQLESSEICVTSTHTIRRGTLNPVLTVTDRRGRPVDSWRFQIDGLADELPTIEILEPAEDRDATSITEVPVRIRAKDDYGLGEVGLVLEAAGETRWILEKVIDTSNQRQANEMVSAMLEEIPLEITDNVRLYAYALDRKPRGGPRALSHLRSIDIRQFKRRWRFKVLPPMPGGGPKREDLVGLEKIIERQRGIVSQIFVLKGGGRDSISQVLFQKCNGEAAKEDALALDVSALVEAWIETGRIEQDDITLLEVAGEQMVQAGRELRVPDRDEAFEVADASLGNLLRLRKRLMTLILKSNSEEGEPMDPKEQPPRLTEMAEEARRLAREEADVRSQLEDEELARSTDPEVTRRQQDVAIHDAGELYSRLLTHPEKTEGALDLMDEAEKAMQAAGAKLHAESATGTVLDLALAEQRLLELAEFLTVLEMQLASEALEKMAGELEKEAGELAEESESQSEGQGEGESEPESGQGEEESKRPEGEESPKGSKSGENGKPQQGGDSSQDSGENFSEGRKRPGETEDGESEGESEAAESLARAGRRARLTGEVLKALAEREARRARGGEEEDDGENGDGEPEDGAGGTGDALARLEKGLGLAELAEALEKAAGGKEGGEEGEGASDSGKEMAELAGRLDAAGERMRELARELNSTQLTRLAEVKEEIEKLKQRLDGKGADEGDGEESGDGGDGAGEENPFAALLAGAGTGGKEESGAGPGKNEEGEPSDRPGPGPLTGPFALKLRQIDDRRVRDWGRMLRDMPFDRSMIPVLEAIEARVDELVGEIPQSSALTGGRRAVPEKNRREIEDYFRDLSDDFGGETWMKRNR